MAAVANVESGIEQVEEAWEKAKFDGRWLVGVWSVSEDGTLKERVTTWNFPTGDLLTAADAMARVGRETRMQFSRPEKLPPANMKSLLERAAIEPNGRNDE